MNSAFESTVNFVPELPCPGTRPGWLRRLMRPFTPVEPESLDRSTGLYNMAGLFNAARAEARHHSDDTRSSAIVLEFSELVEVRDIYGAAIGRKVVAKVVRRLRALAGVRGFAGRTGPTQFTVVFVGVSARDALFRLQRVLGKPARVEFDAGDSEIVLVPEFVVDATEPGGSIQAVYRDMARELARMRKDERRRLDYLTVERERHSRPMVIRD